MAVFTSSDNSKRFGAAMTEILSVGFIASATVNLFTSAPLWACVPICAGASGWWYIKNLTVFRFALTENSKVLLTGPGGSQLEVSSSNLGGNTNPWKYRNEDAKADNQVSTGVQPIIELYTAVEGKDTGNRVGFKGQIAWRICNLENFNQRGSVEQATNSVISALTTDFKRFAGDEMKKGGQGLRLTEDVVLKEDESRDSFLEFILSPERVSRNEQMGFEIVASETLLEDVEYDHKTQSARTAYMEKIKAAQAEADSKIIEGKGEAARIDQILDIATKRNITPRLALAADRQSGDVSEHQTGFKVEIAGDSDTVKTLAKAVGNPVVATALVNATTTPRRKPKGKTDGTK